MAFPLGAQCPTFLTELANQKAANPGWEPRVYLTNTCASPLILGVAGEAANGLLHVAGVRRRRHHQPGEPDRSRASPSTSPTSRPPGCPTPCRRAPPAGRTAR